MSLVSVARRDQRCQEQPADQPFERGSDSGEPGTHPVRFRPAEEASQQPPAVVFDKDAPHAAEIAKPLPEILVVGELPFGPEMLEAAPLPRIAPAQQEEWQVRESDWRRREIGNDGRRLAEDCSSCPGDGQAEVDVLARAEQSLVEQSGLFEHATTSEQTVKLNVVTGLPPEVGRYVSHSAVGERVGLADRITALPVGADVKEQAGGMNDLMQWGARCR